MTTVPTARITTGGADNEHLLSYYLTRKEERSISLGLYEVIGLDTPGDALLLAGDPVYRCVHLEEPFSPESLLMFGTM